MRSFFNQVVITFKGILRDRLLHAVLGVALVMLLLVPVFSVFSMRQVQELSITLSLSAISFIILVISVLLGSSSIWRDVERRYTASVLALPLSRSEYIIGKFCGIALFIITCTLVLGITAAGVIAVVSAGYPSDMPVHWQTVVLSLGADALKYILLTAIAMVFSSISTSFFLPFFCTLAIYFAGSGSQEVFEYVSGQFGRELPLLSVVLIKTSYYLLPNFTAFNLKVQAIYGLPISLQELVYTTAYFLIYTSLVLYVSVWIFSRRQLP